ncbi:MAG: hypothetical protein ABR576_00150 [Thermoanaerobaculia bacterium]
MRPPRPHTPAPWIANGCHVTTADGTPVGSCQEPPNARRTAAAVNACEGIPIRELENGILADLFFQCGRLKNARIAAIMEKIQLKKEKRLAAASEEAGAAAKT